MSTRDEIIAAVERAAEALQPAPLCVIIYGSVSRGAFDQGSDVDVLLVGESFSYDSVKDFVDRVESEVDHQVNPTSHTPSDLRDPEVVDHAVCAASVEGLLVRGRPLGDFLDPDVVYDEQAAAREAFDRSLRSAREFGSLIDKAKPTAYDAAQRVERAANAVTLSAGRGRFKGRAGRREADLEILRDIAGQDLAKRVAALMNDADAAPLAALDEGSTRNAAEIIDLLVTVASDAGREGATHL